MSLYAKLALAGAVLSLFGCKTDIPITTLPSKVVLESYGSAGRLIAKEDIESNSPLYQNLKELLLREKADWDPVVASYVPGPYIFRGEGMTIRCYRNLIVIDFSVNGKYVSKQKRISGVLASIGLSESTVPDSN